jgi:hypothetical protein
VDAKAAANKSESNVSVGDTCKEIGVTRHDSDDAVTEQKHNAEFLAVNRNFDKNVPTNE